jgi:hypothetical protein
MVMLPPDKQEQFLETYTWSDCIHNHEMNL